MAFVVFGVIIAALLLFLKENLEQSATVHECPRKYVVYKIPQTLINCCFVSFLFFRLSEYEKGGRDASEFLKWQETTRKVWESKTFKDETCMWLCQSNNWETITLWSCTLVFFLELSLNVLIFLGDLSLKAFLRFFTSNNIPDKPKRKRRFLEHTVSKLEKIGQLFQVSIRFHPRHP